MTDRAQLISLADKEDLDGFLAFMKDRKLEDKDLFDTLTSCSKRQLDDIWDGVQKMSLVSILTMDPGDEGQSLDNCMCVINADLNLALCTLNQDGHYIPSAMLEAVVILHGILTSLPKDEDRLKNNMSKLFEQWWTMELDGYEELGVNTLIYLLDKSVGLDDVSACHLKRVWNMRAILTMVHLDSEGSARLKELVLQCFRKTKFMKVPEGRRFLAFVFTLNSDFVETLHEIVKNVLPYSPKSWWEKYGEIYFQAWLKTSGTLREKIENHCIADIMSHAIHARRDGAKPMSTILIRVLVYIHKQKVLKDVDAMLLRLYNPILWRSLKVPNPTVRANAVTILCDAFPLRDPTASAADNDALLQKQFDILMTLLFDPSHTVRVLTIQGICRVMAVYWELIPVAVIKSLVTPLVQELVFDSSSAEVRHAVFKSLTLLLNNHLCHPLMKMILPKLGKHIFDISEIVRIAFVDMLLQVQHIKTIPPLSIVPIEDLLAVLESDTPPVCRRVVKLLYPSYVVLSQPQEVQISRIVQMIQVNPAASRVFFLYAVKTMTLQETAEYLTTLCLFVLNIATKSNHKNQDESEDEESLPTLDDGQVNIEDDDNCEISMKDENLLTKILDGMVIMWTSVSDELFKPKNDHYRRDLQKKISITVPHVLKAFQTSQAHNAIVMLAANVSPAHVPMVSSSCMSKLRKLDVDANPDDYGVLLEAMCKWGKVDEVLEQVSDWLRSEVTGNGESQPTSSKKGKPKKKSVCFVDPINPKPKMAVSFLMNMLRNPICQQILLSSCKDDLVQILVILADIQKVVDGLIADEGKLDAGVDPEFLESAFSAYLSLCVILNDVNSVDSLTTLKDLVAWADSCLVVAVTVRPQAADRQKKKLYNTTLAMSMLAPDDTLSETLSQPKKKLLNVTSGPTMLTPLDETRTTDKRDSVTEMTLFAESAARSHKRSCSDDVAGLAERILKKLLEFCSNALMVGMGDAQFTKSLCNLCVGCVETDNDLDLLDKVVGCLGQIVDFRHVNRDVTPDNDEVTVPHCMGKVFNAMATYLLSHTSTYEKAFSSVRDVLSSLFSSVIQYRRSDSDTHKQLLAKTVATVITEHAHSSREDDFGAVKKGIKALPPLSCLLLTILQMRTTSRQAFVDELLCFLQFAPVSDVHMVHGSVHLVAALQKTKFAGPVLLQCVEALKSVLPNVKMESEETDSQRRQIMQKINSKMQSANGKEEET